MWFLTQHRAGACSRTDPDYLAVAKQVNQIELYKQAAAQVKVGVAEGADAHVASSSTAWCGTASDPKKYAGSFKVHA